jgi:hypothetical protein
MDITREQCQQHFIALQKLHEEELGQPHAEAFRTHKELDDTTFRARKNEVDITRMLDNRQLRTRVDSLRDAQGCGPLYRSHVRFTQYACQCARNGDLEEARDALMTAHTMDKIEFAKTNEPPRDVAVMSILIPLISALDGPEDGVRFASPYMPGQDINNCLMLVSLLSNGKVGVEGQGDRWPTQP